MSHSLGIGRTFQNLQLFDNMTVLENVMCGQHRFTTHAVLPIALRLAAQRQEAASATPRWKHSDLSACKAQNSMNPPSLPFGHQRLVEIARALALRPRLLLMDEPASGLNDTETERLAELIVRIAALGVTVLVVEHDMRLVMGLADHVVVMDHGEMIAEGAPDIGARRTWRSSLPISARKLPRVLLELDRMSAAATGARLCCTTCRCTSARARSSR